LLFLDARRLAGQVAQVVELGAANPPAADHRDVGDHGAVEREDALDTDAVGDLSDREAFADAATATRDAHALERLNALLVSFLDADVHAERVAGTKGRHVAAQPGFLSFDEGVHRSAPG